MCIDMDLLLVETLQFIYVVTVAGDFVSAGIKNIPAATFN